MMKWIAQSCVGMNGETLYPGNMNAEVSYEIDNMIEISDGTLSTFNAYLNPPVSDEKAKEMAEGGLRKLFFKIDEQLKCNGNPNFVVGNHMTTADISLGAFILKYVYNQHQPHRKIYGDELKNFPRVNQWANNTIVPVFGQWFDKEPKGMLQGAS